MTWEDIIPRLTRALISDLTEPYTYCEEKLTELVVYAAHFVNREVSFDTDYTISIVDLDITPDPSFDGAFVNTVALKTAVMLLTGEVKVAAGQNISVTDGPSNINLGGIYKAKSELLKNAIENYEKAKLMTQMGLGQAIMTPTTNQNVSSNFTFN